MAEIVEYTGGGDESDYEDPRDHEDPRERNDYNIEEAILGYNDEPPIRHDVYPDSESDEEDVPIKERDRSDMRRGNGNLFKGQVFYNGIAFKEAVLDYVLNTARNIRQYRYDKTKLGFNCVGDNCEWRVYCSRSKKTGKWRITRFVSLHSCVPNGECELIREPVIARLFIHKIRDDPEYFMPMKIEELIKERWKIIVTRIQCQNARRKALKMIDAEYAEQFSRLRDYEAEILESNEGSYVEIDTFTNEEGQDVFNRFYVCFDALRRSWKETCSCFLRSKMKGQLLVALGRDADNAIYPIAWAVVQVENTPNWLWFVKKIKDDLGLQDGEGYILISDRQKGLIKAVELELPNIEHRMCVRHIYGNLKAKHGKKSEMKPFIWNLAWSYNEAEYNEHLKQLLRYDSGVYEDVMKSNPRSWCRAFYKIGNHCEDVENNFTESFNSSIVKARERPFVPMLQMIARLAMVRIAKRDVKSHMHQGICTPYVVKYLQAEHELASECKVYRSTNNMFLVELRGCSHLISLGTRTCTCRKWQITGIPCEHGYGVILDKKLHVDDFVSHWFRTAIWRRTYTDGLIPMRSAGFWPCRSEGNLIHVPPEPPQPGRQKKNKKEKRKKGKNESPFKKKPKLMKRVQLCGVCKEAGHNSRFHKVDKKGQASQGQASQGQASQGQASQGQSSQGQASQSQP